MTSHSVAMVTCFLKKMIIAYLPMIGILVDKNMLASIDIVFVVMVPRLVYDSNSDLTYCNAPQSK